MADEKTKDREDQTPVPWAQPDPETTTDTAPEPKPSLVYGMPERTKSDGRKGR